jgi:hypothetical protein
MPVRLTRPYNGQPVNTLFWGPPSEEQLLKDTGNADSQIELASDYQQVARIVTTAASSITRNALVYRMNSASPQTLTVGLTGYWPVGAVVSVIQEGAGAFTIAAGTGITINTALTSLVSKGQWNVAQLLKRSATEWVAFGGLGG